MEKIETEKAQLEAQLEETENECVEQECVLLEGEIIGLQKDLKNLENYLEEATCYSAEVETQDKGLQTILEEEEAHLQKLKN